MGFWAPTSWGPGHSALSSWPRPRCHTCSGGERLPAGHVTGLRGCTRTRWASLAESTGHAATIDKRGVISHQPPVAVPSVQALAHHLSPTVRGKGQPRLQVAPCPVNPRALHRGEGLLALLALTLVASQWEADTSQQPCICRGQAPCPCPQGPQASILSPGPGRPLLGRMSPLSRLPWPGPKPGAPEQEPGHIHSSSFQGIAWLSGPQGLDL